jgi:hypothetical protein
VMNLDFDEFMNYEPMSNRQVIAWWETRRVYYNAALLFIGIAAIAGFVFIMDKAIPVGEDAIEPMALLFFVPFYALMANVCYTLGWIIELAGRNTDTVHARRRAVDVRARDDFFLSVDQSAILVLLCFLDILQ